MTRGVVGLLLEAVFFGIAFGFRSWVQWRRTGATGFIRPRRGAPVMELFASTLFVTSIVLLAVGPIADIAGTGRIDLLDTAPVAVVGFLLAVAGIVLTTIAQLSMGDSWRVGVDPHDRTDLVTHGIFGVVRNPIFTAMVLASIGLALLVPNGWTVAALVVLVVGLELQVRFVEEPYLHRTHGASYEAYLAATGRFVPGVGHALRA
jgi:protein-S-isoprenylcysteine O-methyltransferase Ste14